jgi:enamine deaminase RidA (YjgF/YER057c/UK114 family)
MRQVLQTGGFEDVGGYSRAVRDGQMISVSVNAPTGPDGSAVSPDIYEQTRHAFLTNETATVWREPEEAEALRLLQQRYA